MATSRKRAILFTAVPLFILMLPLSIYFIDSAAASDKISRNVTIAGVDVARYSSEDAVVAVDGYAADLTGTMATVSVNGYEFELDPADVGLTFDSEGAVDTAMLQYKDGITDWLRAFSQEVDVPVSATIDSAMLETQLEQWEDVAIENPAFDGSIEISNGSVVVEYPQNGEAIDPDAAVTLITEALRVGSKDVIVLPTITAVPTLTNDDFDAAKTEAERILSTPVVLTQDEYGFELRIDTSDIGRSFSATVVHGNPSAIEFSFDREVFTPRIEAQRALLELPPQDAYWETTVVDDFEDVDENYEITDSPQKESDNLPPDDTIVLIPAKNGTTIDRDAVAAAIETAARGDGSGELPIVLDAPPAFTTEMAEAYGELYEVSEFTTWTPGTNRVHNIHLMADTVDNSIVWPGEEFSVNEVVGRRTLEKGYKYDCAIVTGELACEEEPVNVGGGVSQFGTTIFNAIYFGCFKDVTHTPHSIYFTKYPEGREATLGYPYPDVAFLNDSEAPVIIRTSYTPRTITVTFFGNQKGMTCGTERSDRSGVTSPVKEYQADPDGVVQPGQEKVKSSGSKGWSVTNTRIFYDASGIEIKRETFPWRYRGEKNVILLHPCDTRVGGNGECPIQVPGVTGQTQSAATAALGEAGFAVAVVTADTADPAKEGIVLSATPGGWQDPGTTITITVGHYTGDGGGDGGSDG